MLAGMARKQKETIGNGGKRLTVPLNVLLSPELHQRLIDCAAKDGRAKANMARVLIEEGLDRRTAAA